MDVYSFGILCLYILFQECLVGSRRSSVSCLGDLKKRGKGSLLSFARDAVSKSALLGELQKDSLEAFFESTLSDELDSRDMDFETLINHLGQRRYVLQYAS